MERTMNRKSIFCILFVNGFWLYIISQYNIIADVSLIDALNWHVIYNKHKNCLSETGRQLYFDDYIRKIYLKIIFEDYQIPWASMAFATFSKPAIFAPTT